MAIEIYQRRCGPARSGLILAMAAVLVPCWLCLPRATRPARWITKIFFRLVLRAFDIRIQVQGRPIRTEGTLYVANHVSWTDIPLLGYIVDGVYVAKQDVADWPLIGAATRRYGAIFVDRMRRGTVADQHGQVRGSLTNRQSVILFPEGTTGDGASVLPFRSSLFAALLDADAPVQPIAILYRNRDGTALSDMQREKVAWIGDQGLFDHIKGLSHLGGLDAEIHFLPGQRFDNRKVAARTSEEQIGAILNAQAAMLKREA